MVEMEKAVALFKNPNFTIQELINSIYLDTLIVKQCFQSIFILFNNQYNNQSNETSSIYPINLFVLKDYSQINISSLFIKNSSENITSWTYSPFYIHNNNNHNNDNHINWLPNLIISQIPLLIHIPIYSIYSINKSIRWLITFRLSIQFNKNTKHVIKDPFLILSVYPYIVWMNSLKINTSNSWYSPKIIINLQNINNNQHQQQIDLNLFTYTSDDLFFNNDDRDHDRNRDRDRDPDRDRDHHYDLNNDNDMTIYFNIHIMNNSNSYLLHVYHPFIFTLNNFIYNYYNLDHYFSLMLYKSINAFPLCIYPFYKQWTIHTTTNNNHDNQDPFDTYLVAKQQWIMNQFEMKLNQFCTWNLYKFNKSLLYLITNGIFNGLCIYINMNWDLSKSIIIEIRSSSHILLNLLDHVLLTQNNINDHFHLVPYIQSLLPNDTLFNIQKSIIDLLHCLIYEIQYLIDEFTQLIQYTMYKRIPKLPVYFKDLTNILDIVYYSNEWRTIVNNASIIPIDYNILSNLEYNQLYLQTDIHLKYLCFENSF
ncbi:unnamed protein product [Schistosoma spindalis]|nr:unnamed protein product [Schistosoma spindale]